MSVKKHNRLQVFAEDAFAFVRGLRLVPFVLLLGGLVPSWAPAFGAPNRLCGDHYHALVTRAFHYKIHYETAEKFPDLVAAIDTARAAFYKDKNVPPSDLLTATEKLWKAAGLDYERIPVPASPNLGIPAHEVLRILPASLDRGPGLHKYAKDIFRIYAHSTVYDPFVLRWTNSTGLRQSRDVWKDGQLNHFEDEVLISDSVARDISIKDTLTHEAIHLQSGALRRQGIDADLHGWVQTDDHGKLSQTNGTHLYPSSMWLEELATAAHDAYRAGLAIKYELENLQIESKNATSPDAQFEILKRAHALLEDPRLNAVILRSRDLSVIATQTQDVTHRLSGAFEHSASVSLSGESGEGLNWVRVKAPEVGLTYVVPLLGPELSKLPTWGEGALPILKSRLDRLDALASGVRDEAQASIEATQNLRQNAKNDSLEALKRKFDGIMESLERTRVQTLKALPRRPRHPARPAPLAA